MDVSCHQDIAASLAGQFGGGRAGHIGPGKIAGFGSCSDVFLKESLALLQCSS